MTNDILNVSDIFIINFHKIYQQPFIYIQKMGSTRVGSSLALLANIRLGRKWLTIANTLAYYRTETFYDSSPETWNDKHTKFWS